MNSHIGPTCYAQHLSHLSWGWWSRGDSELEEPRVSLLYDFLPLLFWTFLFLSPAPHWPYWWFAQLCHLEGCDWEMVGGIEFAGLAYTTQNKSHNFWSGVRPGAGGLLVLPMRPSSQPSSWHASHGASSTPVPWIRAGEKLPPSKPLPPRLVKAVLVWVASSSPNMYRLHF